MSRHSTRRRKKARRYDTASAADLPHRGPPGCEGSAAEPFMAGRDRAILVIFAIEIVLQVGADEVIESRRIGFAMVAHAVAFHGTATTMSKVLLSGAHSVYVGRIPGDPSAPVAYGDLLVDMQLSKQGGLVIGVRTPLGKEIINPPKSLALDPGSVLIDLAEEPLLEPPN
jgi:hypothetical protein